MTANVIGYLTTRPRHPGHKQEALHRAALPKCAIAIHLAAPENNRQRTTRDFPSQLVGVARFELTTPCSRSRCATRLRHTPTFEECSPLYCPKMPASSHDKRAQNPSLQGRGEISMLPPSRSGDVACFSDFAGASPSGKAAAFDAAMRRFESCRPSQFQIDLTN